MAPTPFARSAALGEAFGVPDVWIKNDGLNRALAEGPRLVPGCRRGDPPGRADDRHGVHRQRRELAGRGLRRAGRRAVIFVPKSAPKAKLAQMLLHGAQVVPVDGTYDDAFRLSLDYTARYGGLNRNTAYTRSRSRERRRSARDWQQNGGRAPRRRGADRRRRDSRRRAQGVLT